MTISVHELDANSLATVAVTRAIQRVVSSFGEQAADKVWPLVQGISISPGHFAQRVHAQKAAEEQIRELIAEIDLSEMKREALEMLRKAGID
jgi:hypothetical protein